MSWDQPEFSFDHGQPPTPSRTPTSPSFNDLFQTPRIDSSFLDSKSNWNSHDASGNYADILKTPRALLFSTSAAASPAVQSKPFAGERQELASAMMVNAEKLLSTPSFEGMQAETSRFGQSLGVGNKTVDVGIESHELSLDTSTSFHSASSMQTPPPTSTSARKRKGRQSEGRTQASQSAAERRMSVPIAPKPLIHDPASSLAENVDQDQSSIFSPSIFGYHFDTPATAPAYPQAKLLWGSEDQSNNIDFLSHTPGLFDSPRHSQNSFGLNTSVRVSQPAEASNVRFAVPATQSIDLDGNTFAPSSSHSKSSSQAFSNAVNPSLLFSSPSKVPRPGERLSASNRVLSEDALQPYAYQMQEAKRERVSMNMGKIKKRRKPSVDSPAVQAALETLRDGDRPRPHFRRSMTDSALPALIRPGSRSGSGPIQRRSSPLKRQQDGARRAKRTSIALTIDENGRARTETRVIEDSGDSGEDAMEVDERSEGSSSSEEESEDELIAAPKTALPRLGRFTTSNSAQHSKKSSYTSLYSTGSYQDDPKLPDLKDRSSHPRRLQPLQETSFGSNDGRDIAMDSDDDRTAQSELRKMAQRRQIGSRGYNNGATFGEINEAALANLSPTTIPDPELMTPTSGPSSTTSGIRCMCNVAVDDGQMIQCESCRNWLHVPCTGKNPNRLPPIYLCLFCTGPTPVARGGRVRDPQRGNRGGVSGGSSPLAHKSGRFR